MRKNLKRILAFSLIAAFVFLFACSVDNKDLSSVEESQSSDTYVSFGSEEENSGLSEASSDTSLPGSEDPSDENSESISGIGNTDSSNGGSEYEDSGISVSSGLKGDYSSVSSVYSNPPVSSSPSSQNPSSSSKPSVSSSKPPVSSSKPPVSSSSSSKAPSSSSSKPPSSSSKPNDEPGTTGTYVWKSIPVSGGGYVTGLVAHPLEQDLYYIRTDVGGAYRWDKTYQRWLPILDMFGSDKTNYYSVESLNVDPTNPDIVYAAVGRNATNGEVLRSTDRGRTWTETGLKSRNVKFSGNGNYRWAGERLAVDPNKGSIVYYGSRQNGLWKNENISGSGTWTQVSTSQVPVGSGTTSDTVDGTNKVGINFVAFDKNGGVSSSGATNIIYAGVYGNGVYKSTNAGSSWSLIQGSPQKPARGVVASDGTLYVAHDSGVAKISRSGTVTNISSGLDSGKYVGVSVDTQNPNIVMVARHDLNQNNPIYRSTNGGGTWKRIDTRRGSFPHWWASWFNFARTSSLVLDPFDSSRVWYTDWYGVWRTDDIDASRPIFNAYSNNHEELCISALLSPSSGEAKLLSGAYDISGFRHTDLDTISREHIPNSDNYHDTLFYAAYEGNANIIYKTASGQSDLRGAVYKSTDNGKNWTKLTGMSSEYGGGKLAVSATDPNRLVWVPTKKAPLYSTNGGSSWQPVGGATSTDFSPDMWNEKVIIIAANKVGSNVFYLYRPGVGFWRSTDGGANFTRLDNNGISNVSGGTWLPGTGVKAVPNQDGGVWVYNTGGLFKSTNYGSSFTKVSNVKECAALSFGKAKPGSGQPAAIYIFGKLSSDSQSENRLYRSDDMGSTWVRINDEEHKFGLLCVLEADGQVYGRVYVGASGRGLYYGEMN